MGRAKEIANRSSRGTEGQGPSTMKADYPKWEIDFNQIFCPEGDVYFDDEKILLW